MANNSLIMLLLGTFFTTASSFAQSSQPTSFNIGSASYFIHQISYQDVSHINPKNSVWNQNMVADNQYIYLADHTANSPERLTIKRFSASTGDPVSDLVIHKEDLEYYYIDVLTDDERCFYLCPCEGDNHFILFMNTSADGINPKIGFYFYLIDKEGNITNEFQAKNVPGSQFGTISDFGIPAVIGKPDTGNFEILIPMVDWNGNTIIANYTYANGIQKSCYASFFCSNSSGIAFSKPSIHIVDDNYMILDDNDIYPSLYSYRDNPNVCYGTLDSHHVMGHGIMTFSLDGHRMLCSGDVHFPEGDTKNGTTIFRIGIWDNNTSPAQVKSRASSAVDFSDYQPVTSLQFDKSNLPSGISSTYRQFISTSNFNNGITHLHMYVPGEFLTTYQINKNDTPTSIEEIKDTDRQIGYTIVGRTIYFDSDIDTVTVFDTTGRTVFSSRKPLNSINFSNFAKGLYFIVTDNLTIKTII